jgi:hypothetical protein
MTDPIRDELHRLSMEFNKLLNKRIVEETMPEELVQKFGLTLREAKAWLKNELNYLADEKKQPYRADEEGTVPVFPRTISFC